MRNAPTANPNPIRKITPKRAGRLRLSPPLPLTRTAPRNKAPEKTSSKAASPIHTCSAVIQRAIVSPSTSPPVKYSNGLLICFSSYDIIVIAHKHGA